MDLVTRIRLKQLIKKVSNDRNFSLSLKEQSYWTSLLVKEGIDLTLILTLLKIQEFTQPEFFNISISPEYRDREKLNLYSKSLNNYFYLREEYDNNSITVTDLADLKATAMASLQIKAQENGEKFVSDVKDEDEKPSRKSKPDEDLDEDDGGQHSDLTNTEKGYGGDNAEPFEVPYPPRTHGRGKYGSKGLHGVDDNPADLDESSDDLEDDNEIMNNQINGNNDPISQRVKEEQRKAKEKEQEEMDNPDFPDYNKENNA